MVSVAETTIDTGLGMINGRARTRLPWWSHPLPMLSVVLGARDPPRLYEDEPTYIGDGDEPIHAQTEAKRLQWAGDAECAQPKEWRAEAAGSRRSGAPDG